MKCNVCHNEIKNDAIFCPICGNKVKSETIVPPPMPIPDLPESAQISEVQKPSVEQLVNNAAPKKSSKGLFVALTIIFALASLVLGFFLFSTIQTNKEQIKANKSQITSLKKENSGLETQIAANESEISSLNSELGTCNSQLGDSQSLASQYQQDALEKSQKLDEIIGDSIYVKVNAIYNADVNSDKISDYLYADTLRYLTFDYQVYASGDLSQYVGDDLEIRIYKPDGTLSQGDESPIGCSYIRTISSTQSTGGWGNDNGGSFTSGLYVIEFVYQGNVVGSQPAFIW